MPDSDSLPASADASVVKYSGIYNADGGVAGELRYLWGHMLGTAECSLCDITHSTVRRKPAWDRMVARMGVPIVALHRNELDADLEEAVRGVALPVVIAHRADGSMTVALDAAELASLDGSVDAFELALLSTRRRS